MKYQIVTHYKDSEIVIKGDPIIPALFIDGKAYLLGSNDSHPFLSNKQLVCKLYNAALDEIRKTPKSYFKSLDFAKLVPAIEHIVAYDSFLQKLRALNLDSYSRNGSGDKIQEEISKVIQEAIGNINGKKFSDPENCALAVISEYSKTYSRAFSRSETYKCHYVGSEVDSYTLQNLYKPIQDDDSAVQAKVKEFHKFPFGRYISAIRASEILNKVDAIHSDLKGSIELFRKMRAIAGNDVVNWGPHKWASQVKKSGLKDSGYAAYGWLVNDVKEHLIKKGIKPAEKKLKQVDKLKAAYAGKDPVEGAPIELTQQDYVRLFKAASVSDAAQYVHSMTAETAVSLLEMTTKNVTEKLYDSYGYADRGSQRFTAKAALTAIVSSVASDRNPKAFKALTKFLKEKQMQAITWDLLRKYSGEYTINAFMDYVRPIRYDSSTRIERELFDQVVSQIPVNHRYTTHAACTEAYLEFAASESEKIALLKTIRLAGNGERIAIDFSLSAKHFQTIPYEHVREFLKGEDNRVTQDWTHFISAIVNNKDTETARSILVHDDHNGFHEHSAFFNLFSFDEKVAILNETDRNNISLKNVFTKEELNDFGRIAFTSEKLVEYASELPIASLNRNVKLADVTSRIMDAGLYIRLDEKVIKALSKENAARVLARAKIHTPHRYVSKGDVDTERVKTMRLLYSKFTRKEIEEIKCAKIGEFGEVFSLIDFMTPSEIDEHASNPKFLRMYLDLVSDGYLAKFKDKDAFKNVVGDRRSRENDHFGKALEARLEKIKVAA